MSIKLIGIEINPVISFGDKLSPALNKRLATVRAKAERVITHELDEDALEVTVGVKLSRRQKE